jgi:hypothetical protein
MRVVHLLPAAPGTGGIVGGAERYASELARTMADVMPTTLVTFGSADADDTAGSLRLRTLGRPWHVRGQRSNPVSWQLPRALSDAYVSTDGLFHGRLLAHKGVHDLIRAVAADLPLTIVAAERLSQVMAQ